MFQHILVPLDGSPRAERALGTAARLARATQGQLILLRAVTMTTEFWPAQHSPEAHLEPMIHACMEEAHTYLAGLASSPLLHDIPVKIVVPFGPPAAGILEAVPTYQIDLIILGSHSSKGTIYGVMSSISEKVSRNSPVPVLVLREHGPIPAEESETRPLSILVGLDGSVQARAAIAPAARLVAALSAPERGTIHLAYAMAPGANESNDAQRKRYTQIQEYLRTVSEHLRSGEDETISTSRVQIRTSIVVSTDAVEGLARLGEHGEDMEGPGESCDLMALSTHGQSEVQPWGMGSFPERMLKATKLPLLVVRPQHTHKSSLPVQQRSRSVIVQDS